MLAATLVEWDAGPAAALLAAAFVVCTVLAAAMWLPMALAIALVTLGLR